MKKLLLYILLTLGLSFTVFAQTSPTNREKIEAAKIGFINEKLELTPKQAETFWPMYNEYTAKKKEIKKAINKLKIENNENETDAEIIDDIKKINSYRQKEVDLEKEYIDKFLTILTPKQLAALYKAEKQFTKLLLDKLKEENK